MCNATWKSSSLSNLLRLNEIYPHNLVCVELLLSIKLTLISWEKCLVSVQPKCLAKQPLRLAEGVLRTRVQIGQALGLAAAGPSCSPCSQISSCNDHDDEFSVLHNENFWLGKLYLYPQIMNMCIFKTMHPNVWTETRNPKTTTCVNVKAITF